MAVRALIPAERLNIAHVNSVDGSTDYEYGTEYKAGTVVTYNGNTYVANIDIADTDTDTPDAAPEKWGLCPNARSLVEGGEMADLENRVSALETTVGDESNGLVKDVSDLQSEIGNYQLVENSEIDDISDGTITNSQQITSLVAKMQALIDALDDDDIIFVYRYTISGVLSAIPKLFTFKKGDTYSLVALSNNVSTNDCDITIVNSTTSPAKYSTALIGSGSVTVTDKGVITSPLNRTMILAYMKYKKIK